MAIEFSLIVVFIALAYLIVTVKSGFWHSHFWFACLGLFGSLALGIAILVLVNGGLDDLGRSILYTCIFVAVLIGPTAWIVAQYWRNWAELEAEVLVARGRYKEAIQLLQVKRYSEGATLLLLNDLAHCLDAVGEHEEALLVLDEAELRFGMQRELTVKRAVCLTRLGQIDEALAVMTAAVEAAPHDFELAYQFTVMFLKLNRRADAEKQFDRTEILFLREKSDQVRQEWRPKLERLRRQINNPSLD